MRGMTTHGSAIRLIAVVLAVVLMATVAAPSRAEAVDPFTIMAIAGAAVVVVILIAYLIVASTKGKRMEEAEQRQPVMIACVEAEGQPRNCWAVDRPGEPVSFDQIEPVLATPQMTPQDAPQS
jgi:hypothetical protein